VIPDLKTWDTLYNVLTVDKALALDPVPCFYRSKYTTLMIWQIEEVHAIKKGYL
jgi:hypothetical protein